MPRELTRTTPAKIESGFAAGGYSLDWQCPGCGHVQGDSVDPLVGPWAGCICESCGCDFTVGQLDTVSRSNWQAACVAAEAATAAAAYVQRVSDEHVYFIPDQAGIYEDLFPLVSPAPSSNPIPHGKRDGGGL